MNIDSFAEKDENTDYDTEGNEEEEDGFGEFDDDETKRTTLTERLSQGCKTSKREEKFPTTTTVKTKPQPLASRW